MSAAALWCVWKHSVSSMQHPHTACRCLPEAASEEGLMLQQLAARLLTDNSSRSAQDYCLSVGCIVGSLFVLTRSAHLRPCFVCCFLVAGLTAAAI